MYADILGKSLTLGINKAFIYGYEPTSLDEFNDCSWGNNMLFAMNDNGTIIYHTAAWYGMNMLMHSWATPRDSSIDIYPAQTDVLNKEGQQLVTAYPIRRPNNRWSITLINKDPKTTWNVEINIFNTTTKSSSALNFPLHFIQYSRSQYHWKANGPNGHPALELPPMDKVLLVNDPIRLPPYSLTVISEN